MPRVSIDCFVAANLNSYGTGHAPAVKLQAYIPSIHRSDVHMQSWCYRLVYAGGFKEQVMELASYSVGSITSRYMCLSWCRCFCICVAGAVAYVLPRTSFRVLTRIPIVLILLYLYLGRTCHMIWSWKLWHQCISLQWLLVLVCQHWLFCTSDVVNWCESRSNLDNPGEVTIWTI